MRRRHDVHQNPTVDSHLRPDERHTERRGALANRPLAEQVRHTSSRLPMRQFRQRQGRNHFQEPPIRNE